MGRNRSRIIIRKRKKKPSMDDFNDDVSIEILVRLPIEFLFRFKCVCKSWFALISNPFFNDRYRSKSRYDISCGLFISTADFSPGSKLPCIISYMKLSQQANPCDDLRFSVGFQLTANSIVIIASCNGMLLCSRNITVRTIANQMFYYVCNPLTKQWVALPKPPESHHYVQTSFICYPPSSVDGCTAQYKVVRAVSDLLSSNILELETFHSDTGQWEESKVLVPSIDGNSFPIYPPVSCNGVLYWIACEGKIVAYNPIIEQCWSIALPGLEHGLLTNVKLGQFNGQLRYAGIFPSGSSYLLKSWALDDSAKWSLEHSFIFKKEVLYGHARNIALSILSFRILIFHPFDRNVVFMYVPPRELITWNLESKRVERVCQLHNSYPPVLTIIIPHMLPSWPTRIPAL